jgi:hypothetical protein
MSEILAAGERGATRSSNSARPGKTLRRHDSQSTQAAWIRHLLIPMSSQFVNPFTNEYTTFFSACQGIAFEAVEMDWTGKQEERSPWFRSSGFACHTTITRPAALHTPKTSPGSRTSITYPLVHTPGQWQSDTVNARVQHLSTIC